ncbi:NAD-dependent protein deacylase-like [Dendronephthya gigantea]|uniref:NAD-dependent protein deacylase-like n=1 Tax=Dendronephthya gigantea TaxID=151771 RepID=UPI001069DBDB|nr:NAD-dependent protein deacylase-like [Dendronephthya gigantea]
MHTLHIFRGRKLSNSFQNLLKMSFHTSKGDMTDFKSLLSKARNVVFLTGAGCSAESGVPTFRGAGGLWRKYDATKLATPESFRANPSLVWEFYSYRRELVLTKKPNDAHHAIAKFEKHLVNQGRMVHVITQNIDGLHQAAGSKNVIELHGSLFKTRCLSCGQIEENRQSPIVPSLLGKGEPRVDAVDAKIPLEELPRCTQPGCDSLVRPHVVWFGESLEDEVLKRTNDALHSCDMCLLVGTSSVVYPAASFAPSLASRGVPVAEFNLEETPATGAFRFHFHGAAGQTLPPILLEDCNKD